MRSKPAAASDTADGGAEPPSATGASPRVGQASEPSWVPFSIASPVATASAPLFESIDPESVGINFRHRASTKPGSLRANTVGCGLCMGDYDGDGAVDLFICDSSEGGALFHNLGGFRFENVTEKAGLTEHDRWSTAAVFVDVDNDGDLDLYVCGFDCANRLYVNNGDGTFVDRAGASGLDFRGSSTVMAFADYDGDGDLDAYLVTNHLPPRAEINYRLEHDLRGVPRVPQQYREYHDLIALPDNEFGVIESGQYDRLYRNNGDGTFADVTDEAGVMANHKGLAATWWDYNDDNLPDLYVANDFYGPDHLYRNQGDGTFVDVAKDVLPHTPWFSMGCDLGDLDNDGLIDFVASDMAGTTRHREKMTTGDMEDDAWFLETAEPRQYMRNAVYLNRGVDRMMEVAFLAGLSASDWTWTVKLMDLDQDGRLDLYVTNGMNRDWENSDLHRAALRLGAPNSKEYDQFWQDQPKLEERNLCFRNRGDLQFESVGPRWGLDHQGVSFGAAFGDLDNDGDLDLVVNNMDDKPSVYRNNQSRGNCLRLRLRGADGNIWGMGARVTMHANDGVQTRYLTPVRGFMSGDDPTVHFGLGDLVRVAALTVQWPSGRCEEFRDLAANRLYTLTEGAGVESPRSEAAPVPWFRRSDRLHAAGHRERPFDDFEHQPLLPHRLSQLGPGLAAGDVDGDGRDEIFLAGAKGMGCRMVAANDANEFVMHELFPVWDDDMDCESQGAVFIDVDADADLDLYVVSGGVECEPGSELLRDRLYVNDGEGHFERGREDQLPDLRDSGGIVAAADYDRDGDLDLFIGGRCVPGQYPVAPNSRLLKNEGGHFRDVADEAPGLQNAGMVTGAVWSDANDDGWIDLLVTYHWGPVRLFVNRSGRLVDSTGAAGLADRLGWWNGVAARDVDNDGDVDYVITNFGLNTKYHATADQPARLFYGDFDGLGRKEIIEAMTDEDERMLPLRGKGTLEKFVTVVAEKCPTYDAYARASLQDIVGQEALDEALDLSVNALESGVLLNDGAAHFQFRPLPRIAQAAPAFGAALMDVNADGRVDLYVVQNFRSSHREVGNMDGGLSLLLWGNGDGSFTPAPPVESGLVVAGDARSVVIADMNQDQRPDFVVGVNDGDALLFEHAKPGTGRWAAVRLRGRPGNPTGVGAKVTLRLDDGVEQTAEVQAGGGYLSQNTSTTYFGWDSARRVQSINVRWPDGRVTHHKVDGETLNFELDANATAAARSQPEAEVQRPIDAS